MSIERIQSPKDAVVNDIIEREWEMFQKTQNIGGRAACQDQFDTFYANRYSQHSIWQPDTLESYRNDLIAAGMAGRNLIAEKYGYMILNCLISKLFERKFHTTEIDCNPDIHILERKEKDSIGIEEVKDFQKEMQFKPFQEKVQIGIIFNLEKLTLQSQNVLLKTYSDRKSVV